MTNSEYLKLNTKELHDSTEEVMQAERIFSNKFTYEHYKELLLKMYQPYYTAEKALIDYHDSEFQAFFNSVYTQKSTFLENDLAGLGINYGEPNASLTIKNREEAYGVLYVLKGSDLGASIINKRLQRISDSWPKKEFTFYQSEPNVSESWSHFKNHIDNIDMDESKRELMLRGAEKTFMLFHP